MASSSGPRCRCQAGRQSGHASWGGGEGALTLSLSLSLSLPLPLPLSLSPTPLSQLSTPPQRGGAGGTGRSRDAARLPPDDTVLRAAADGQLLVRAGRAAASRRQHRQCVLEGAPQLYLDCISIASRLCLGCTSHRVCQGFLSLLNHRRDYGGDSAKAARAHPAHPPARVLAPSTPRGSCLRTRRRECLHLVCGDVYLTSPHLKAAPAEHAVRQREAQQRLQVWLLATTFRHIASPLSDPFPLRSPCREHGA